MAIKKSKQPAAQNIVHSIMQDKNSAERARSDEEWRAIFDSLNDAILILDKDCKITMANKAAAEFLELPLKNITGEYCYRLLHSANGPIANCPLVKMIGSHKPEENELYLDGKGIWARVTACSPFSPEGEETKVILDLPAEVRTPHGGM